MTVDRFAELTLWALAAFLAALLCTAAAYGFQQIRGERACLALGYPATRVDWGFRIYCIKRVDQTDQVVPLDGGDHR